METIEDISKKISITEDWIQTKQEKESVIAESLQKDRKNIFED